MCGRYVDEISPADFEELFGFLPHDYKQRKKDDIRPTDDVGVVRYSEDGLYYELMHWGLIPEGATEVPRSTFNATSENVRRRQSYKGPFQDQRCLIPASGFLEWRDGQRHFIHPANGRVWAFAGLWTRNSTLKSTPVVSCTMMTTKANAKTALVHPTRMPVILAKESFDQWLQGKPDDACELLKPCPEDWVAIDPEVLELF